MANGYVPRSSHTLAAREMQFDNTTSLWISIVLIILIILGCWLRYRHFQQHRRDRVVSKSGGPSTTWSDSENPPWVEPLALSHNKISPRTTTSLPAEHIIQRPISAPSSRQRSSVEVIERQSASHQCGREDLASGRNSHGSRIRNSMIMPDGVPQVQETRNLTSVVLPLTTTALNFKLDLPPSPSSSPSHSLSSNSEHNSTGSTDTSGDIHEMPTPSLHTTSIPVVECARGSSTGRLEDEDVDVSVDRQQTSTLSQTSTREYQELERSIEANSDSNALTPTSSILSAPPRSYTRGRIRTRSTVTQNTQSSISTLPPYPESDQGYEPDDIPLSRAPTYTSTVSISAAARRRCQSLRGMDSRRWQARNLPPLPTPPSSFLSGGQIPMSDQKNTKSSEK